MLTHLSLFTGIGGIDLAAEWAGFRTVGQVEIDDYATAVLEKHWPDVPRWRDIKDVTARSFRKKTKEYCPFLLTGGFPCQPVSCAGKRKGKEDSRWLWPEMLRVVRELRPAWVVGENVAGIINLGLDEVLADLEHQEYECRAFLVPALAVGAWHQRERVFIVAHARHMPRGTEPQCEQNLPEEPAPGGEGWIFPITDSNGSTPARQREYSGKIHGVPESGGSFIRRGSEWWAVEPGMGRVADGVPNRLDRLRCLGNAVVPQQVYPILKGIAEIELGSHRTTR